MEVDNFTEKAQKGESVFISDVRKSFSLLPASKREEIVCVIEMLDGSMRQFDLSLPQLINFEENSINFIKEYLYASLYNIICVLGAQKIYLYGDLKNTIIFNLLSSVGSAFSISKSMKERKGYGAEINVNERIILSLKDTDYRKDNFFIIKDLNSFKTISAKLPQSSPQSFMLAQEPERFMGRMLCGLDVGGTDIKAIAVYNGKIICYKEFDWFPTAYSEIMDIINPIILIVKLLRAAVACEKAKGKQKAAENMTVAVEKALRKDASLTEMETVCASVETKLYQYFDKFDGIGLSFPDVIIQNKIVGGETYKTRGVRNNPNINYEVEFKKLSNIDELLAEHVKTKDRIRIINDGPMAAYSAAVEMAAQRSTRDIPSDIFAHTLGTELGTGWVKVTGEIPNIPLEVYNIIIDLGNWPARNYEPDDVRSINNFNTKLPGTLQKYTSQSGVFRLVESYCSKSRPDLLSDMFNKGFFIKRQGKKGKEGIFVPTTPIDLRKPFLEYCMNLSETDKGPEILEVFKKIGEYLAITSIECDYFLHPNTNKRFLFGRLVKNKACFDLICEGARRRIPLGTDFLIADDSLAASELMKQLAQDHRYTVAQFAQAVGAVYFCNADNNP